MTWLKRGQPVSLEQGSDIPYVILEDGVHLCFDNMFQISSPSGSDHSIKFTIHKNLIARQSAVSYRIKHFPYIVPLDNILQLDSTILNGQTIKHAADNSGEPQTIAITHMSAFEDLEEHGFQEIADLLDGYDHSFILKSAEEDMDAYTRLLSDESHVIDHVDWYRTAVTIAHTVCPKHARKYCWTQTIPELTIECRGLRESEEIESINKAFEFIGISECTCSWLESD